MNTLTMGSGRAVMEQATVLPFLKAPSKVTGKQIPESAADVISGTSEFITDLLMAVVSAQTAEAFSDAREAMFGDYAAAKEGMARIVRVMVKGPVLERLSYEAYADVEGDFIEHGGAKFGNDVKEQAIFTLWTLRKINKLVAAVNSAGASLSGDAEQKDSEFRSHFAFWSMYALFHLDALIVAMKFNKVIYPAVHDEIMEGLRAAVNAYGYIRQGYDLRFPPSDAPEAVDPKWDEEDQTLLSESMVDLALDAQDGTGRYLLG